MTSPTHPYDPWRDLQETWPDVAVVIEPMGGDLLGELRDGRLIALRAGTSSAQRRCTLTHEIVHLERGLRDCGPWQEREEALVHAEAARRLISLDGLAAAVRSLGGEAPASVVAQCLDVDTDTLTTRLRTLRPAERTRLAELLLGQRELWAVA
jgi:hypothetical protein